jgi:hypothetical protein
MTRKRNHNIQLQVGTFMLTLGISLSLIIHSSTGNASEDGTRYVHSAQDFDVYVDGHRERTKVLGLALYKSFYQKSNIVSEDLVRQFLELHDLSKTENAVKAGLFKQYGQDLASLPPQFGELTSYLNSIDTHISEQFFTLHKLSPTQISTLLRIEKIADLVDRAMDPVAQEDFGRKMKRASAWFQSGEMRLQSWFLEANYDKITLGLSYRDRMEAKGRLCRQVI